MSIGGSAGKFTHAGKKYTACAKHPASLSCASAYCRAIICDLVDNEEKQFASKGKVSCIKTCAL